jgi:hypothetical protein
MDEVMVRKEGKQTSNDLSVFAQTLTACAKQVLPENTPQYHWSTSSESGPSSESIHAPAVTLSWSSRISDSSAISDRSRTRTARNARTQPHDATSSRVPFDTVPTQFSAERRTRPYKRRSRSPINDNIVRPNPAKQTSGSEEITAASPFYSLVEHRDTKSREYINDPDGNILSQPKVKPSTQTQPATKLQRLGRHTISLSATEFHINDRVFSITSYGTADDLFSAILRQRDWIDELVKVVNGDYGNIMWDGILGWFAAPGQVTRGSSNLGIKTLQDRE